MPTPGKNVLITLILSIILWTSGFSSTVAAPLKPITTYHLRYDQIFLNNTLVEDNLVMVPVGKSPWEENFSQISITGVITMTARESKNELAKMAKEGAFKRLLLAQGLKSVSSSNQKTVASYEGLVKTPVNIVGTEDFEKGVFHYKALIVFYSLPFPGQGTPLNPKDWIKEKLDDFFQLF